MTKHQAQPKTLRMAQRELGRTLAIARTTLSLGVLCFQRLFIFEKDSDVIIFDWSATKSWLIYKFLAMTRQKLGVGLSFVARIFS